MDGTPFLHNRGATINGQTYNVLSDEGAKQATGSRSWNRETVDAQAVGSPQQFEVPLRDFANGSGYSYEGVPGTYDWADDWDAATPEVLTTWGKRASGASFNAGSDRKGWLRQFGNYLYLARGQWVTKYAIDNTQDVTWAIVERHDLGTDVCAGRPESYNGKFYVPCKTASAGVASVFQQLTTQVTTSPQVQRITIQNATGGTYTLSFGGNTTVALAYNADAATVQAALRALRSLDDVTVTLIASSPLQFHVTMTGVGNPTGSSSIPLITATSSLTGTSPTITIIEQTAGAADTWTAGPSDRKASCFRAWKSALRMGTLDGKIYSCAADPMTSGNWSPAAGSGYVVGDPATPVTDLIGLPTMLGVGKPEGFFTFDENLDVQNHTPDLEQYQDANNFVGMEMAFGQILAPHMKGLMLLWPGAGYQFVGPDQEGRLDQALSNGGGRVASIAPGGRQAFVAINDPYHQTGMVASLIPPSQARGPLIPHAHHQNSGRVEAVAILGNQSQPLAPKAFLGASVTGGEAVTWTDPAKALTQDGGAAKATNATGVEATTKSLNLTNPGNTVPASATIVGVLVRVRRRVS